MPGDLRPGSPEWLATASAGGTLGHSGMPSPPTLDDLPRRLFLDSCTVQTIWQYGEFIWDGGDLPRRARIRQVPNGVANLLALRAICMVHRRSGFEWIVSDASIGEVLAQPDTAYVSYMLEVFTHADACLAESGDSYFVRSRCAQCIDSPMFGYLSEPDRNLLRDALRSGCTGFLTMEARLPRNADHIARTLGIRVLQPTAYWDLLQPYSALFY
jgi:hypothetical protein